MTTACQQLKNLYTETGKGVTVVAVSKTKPIGQIMELYACGHRDFGENYVQELVTKQPLLPDDIRWHFIGHLQTNKVKYIAPFVYMIHAVDSIKLLKEINKQGMRVNRTLPCLLQVHVAREETKFGLDENELLQLVEDPQVALLSHVKIKGVMAMASLTRNELQLEQEFGQVQRLFESIKKMTHLSEIIKFSEISTGMSADYKIALRKGSTLVRIGSLLFGNRAGKPIG